MTYTIRDNNGNVVCSVENTTPTTLSYESINNEIDSINEYSNKLNKSIEAFNFISDTRAMEALGYIKGAGFKANAKAIGHEIWKRIKEFFGRIKQAFIDLGKWIVKIFNNIKNHFNEKKAKKGAEVLSKACDGAKTVDEVAENIVKESVSDIPENTIKDKQADDKDNFEIELLNRDIDLFTQELKNLKLKDYCIDLKKILVLGRKNIPDLYDFSRLLKNTSVIPSINDTNQGLNEINVILDTAFNSSVDIFKHKEVNEKHQNLFKLAEYANIKRRIEFYKTHCNDDCVYESEIIEAINNVNVLEISNSSFKTFESGFKKNIDNASKICDEFCELIDHMHMILDEFGTKEFVKVNEADEYATELHTMIIFSQSYLTEYIKVSSNMILEMSNLITYLIRLADIKEQLYKAEIKRL